jgi:hypothetical protein
MSYKNKFIINKKIPPKKISFEKEIINIFEILQDSISINELIKTSHLTKYSKDKIDIKINKQLNINSLIEKIKEVIKYIISKLNELYNEKNQMMNYIIKLENDIKKNMKEILEANNQKEVFEYKIQKYSKIKEEYEQLKEKVKFKKGKFLNDDKKENEIFILTKENSNLKTEISKLNKELKQYKLNNPINKKNINIRIYESPDKFKKFNSAHNNQKYNNQIINNNIIINNFNRKKSKQKNKLNTSYSNKLYFNKKENKDMNKTMNLFFKDKKKNRVIKNV